MGNANLGPIPRLTESEIQGEAQNLCFNRPFGDSQASQSLSTGCILRPSNSECGPAWDLLHKQSLGPCTSKLLNQNLGSRNPGDKCVC